jgi:glutamine amidotransferase
MTAFAAIRAEHAGYDLAVPGAVTVVDYGLGNLRSVARAFEAQGAPVCVSSDAERIRSAERLVLPGVGAFADGMAGLTARGLVDAVREFAVSGRPMLGICLGAQLLMQEGHEFGSHPGLGLAQGVVRKFRGGGPEKIPHVGWSGIRPPDPSGSWEGELLKDVQPGSPVYFTHSYVIQPEREEDVVSVTDYAGESFCSFFRHENIAGCQFHPEKSGEVGLAIVDAFVNRA